MLALVLSLQLADPAAITRTGVFASPRVKESSGIAVSRTHRGLLWTHNDSGDGPYLYATDTTGADRGARRLPVDDPIDWEDMAEGPCPATPGRCLYVADTGDNDQRRASVNVHAVPEPDPPGGPADTSGVTAAPLTLRLRYPDAPHDVEAIFVTPAGELYLVSKGRTPPVRVFRVPRDAWRSTGVVTATLVQGLGIPVERDDGRRVTAAALSPSGRTVAVRTYTSIHFFSLRPDGRLTAAGACELGRLEPQGEAITFLDDATVLLASEGPGPLAGPLYKVRCAFDRPT